MCVRGKLAKKKREQGKYGCTSSSSCCAASTDIPDPLSPRLPSNIPYIGKCIPQNIPTEY